MTPRPDVSEERKEQIIQAAINVFARRGIHEARMDDIVAETGLSKGALYWYFKSKDDIISAIADMLFDHELQKLEKLNCDDLPAHDCLLKFLDVFIQDLRPMLTLRPVIFEFYALAFRNKSVRQSMQQYLQRFTSIIEPVVLQGIESGEFAAGDARQATLAIGAALEGTLLLWAYAPDMVPVEQQLRASLDLTLKGLEKT
ncbi:MAG: TetR/AcrR family transcriptional regulator [Anaerolineae bacterium]|nr:TetR/AcrR family transcriptional regulator [Anaerolineae bacterium]